MSQRLSITSPVGRIIRGNLYKPNDKDAEGKPLLIKNGPNAGSPRVDYFFALAIPKGAERHWAETPWGQQIWAFGHQAFPAAAQSPTFAWKIEDGDSQVPNKRGRKPCDMEGHKGNWIVKFAGGFPPQIYTMEGNGTFVQVTTKDFVKPGYFAQVQFTVDSNNSPNQPGIYLNHSLVCFRAYGTEISFGPDVNAAGFGAAPLPQGASATPLAVSAPMPAAAPPIPGGGYAPPVPGTPALPHMAAGIVPQPGFVNVPQATPMPPAPIAPVAAPVKQMTALASAPYEAYVAQGWTDIQLIQNGLMTA